MGDSVIIGSEWSPRRRATNSTKIRDWDYIWKGRPYCNNENHNTEDPNIESKKNIHVTREEWGISLGQIRGIK